MKRIAIAILAISSFTACNSNNTDKTTTNTMEKTDTSKTRVAHGVSYTVDTLNMESYVAFDSSASGKLPVVLVIPERWGLTEYAKSRANQLADLGYLAIAVDMYGNGKQAMDPTEAGNLAKPFYTNPQMAQQRFDAALAKALSYPNADTSKVAAIGYCFGGAQVLNMARLGENLDGVVSFHGNLIGVPADKSKLKAQILVCHGEADKFVSPAEVAAFKKQMDSIGANYTFKSYPNATHAFTNPEATATGKKFNMPIEYNEAADKASWEDMKAFFAKIF